MPYNNIKDLPENVKNPLPAEAQRLWLRVFNDIYYDCRNRDKSKEDCEDVSRIGAWSAVKKKFKKNKENKWVKK